MRRPSSGVGAAAATALADNTAALTAIGNDFGFDQVFARQVRAFGRPGDVAIGLSTSGSSPNVLAGLHPFQLNVWAAAAIGLAVGLATMAGDLWESALKRRFGTGQSRFTEGFVVASLVFCVGPLTILGSLRDGLSGDYSLLAIKAMLDGFAALAFSSAVGMVL